MRESNVNEEKKRGDLLKFIASIAVGEKSEVLRLSYFSR